MPVGVPHHITQRGNNRQDVFFTDDDRRLYLRLLHEQAERHGLAVHGSCLMTNHVHLWTALAYVEQNPVRAGMVRQAWEYGWSSAAAHVGGPNGHGLLDLPQWKSRSKGIDWKGVLRRRQDDGTVQAVRRSARTGRPLGSDRFIAKLEAALGRRLRPMPIGRPRKEQPGEKQGRPKRKRRGTRSKAGHK